MLTIVVGNFIVVYCVVIVCIIVVIVYGIGIEDFTLFVRLVYVEAIIMMRYRCKVIGNDDFVIFFIAMYKDQYRVFFVIYY